jgi:hypothetical protein
MAEAAEQSAQDLNSGTKPVDPRHAIDEAKLAAWLEANVEGYAGPLEVRQFKGGQSNPTYQLVTPAKKYVLRRKPPGKLLPSAHAVDREFKVISGLNKANFPVAKAYALCMDEDVIGTIFYVMDNVEGRILWDGTLPDYAAGRAPGDLRGRDRHPGRPAQCRLRGRGPGRLRQARQLFRPPDRPLDQAVQGVRDRQPRDMDKLIDWLPGQLLRPTT